MTGESFWTALDQLVATSQVVIDRPRGSRHPRYTTFVYRLDYGYLAGTTAGDGQGIDVWVGTMPERAVTGAILSVDLEKRDAELKVLLACTPEEMRDILALHHCPLVSVASLPWLCQITRTRRAKSTPRMSRARMIAHPVVAARAGRRLTA
jgi:inorganic pyrophosphatase